MDSQVTLQIGTELDLSGLKRDLAELQSKKFEFDFDFDPNKIGRDFREANRQMVLTPKVDMKELHELNKLLDVKLKHFKDVQKYFDANPLRVKFTSDKFPDVKTRQTTDATNKQTTKKQQSTAQRLTEPAAQKQKAERKSSDADFFGELIAETKRVNTFLKELTSINSLLGKIAKNTGAGILQGFQQAIGKSLFDASAINKGVQIFAGITKDLFKGIDKVLIEELFPPEIVDRVKRYTEAQNADAKQKKRADTSKADASLIAFVKAVDDATNKLGAMFSAINDIIDIYKIQQTESQKASDEILTLTGLLKSIGDVLNGFNETAKNGTQSLTTLIDSVDGSLTSIQSVVDDLTLITKEAESVVVALAELTAKGEKAAGALDGIAEAGNEISLALADISNTGKALIDVFQDIATKGNNISRSFSAVSDASSNVSQGFTDVTSKTDSVSELLSLIRSSGDGVTSTFFSLQDVIKSVQSEIAALGKESLMTADAQKKQQKLDIASIEREKEYVEVQPAATPDQDIKLAPVSKRIVEPQIGDILTEAMASVREIAKVDLGPTLEELQSVLSSMVVDASKKRIKGEYVPDLRMMGKQLGIGTRNKATGLPFKKQELIDEISKFKPEEIQRAMGRIKVQMPEIDPSALKQLTQWYEELSGKIQSISSAPIEAQQSALADVEKVLKSVTKAIAYFETSFSISGDTNQMLQGRKAAFDALIHSTEKMKASWSETGAHIKNEISKIESFSDAEGYEIQKNLSEGSPGINKNIRESWDKTTESVKKNIQAISNEAKNQGQKIKSAMSSDTEEAINAQIQQLEIKVQKEIEANADPNEAVFEDVRNKWKETVDFIAKQTELLGKKAKEQGDLVKFAQEKGASPATIAKAQQEFLQTLSKRQELQKLGLPLRVTGAVLTQTEERYAETETESQRIKSRKGIRETGKMIEGRLFNILSKVDVQMSDEDREALELLKQKVIPIDVVREQQVQASRVAPMAMANPKGLPAKVTGKLTEDFSAGATLFISGKSSADKQLIAQLKTRLENLSQSKGSEDVVTSIQNAIDALNQQRIKKFDEYKFAKETLSDVKQIREIAVSLVSIERELGKKRGELYDAMDPVGSPEQIEAVKKQLIGVIEETQKLERAKKVFLGTGKDVMNVKAGFEGMNIDQFEQNIEKIGGVTEGISQKMKLTLEFLKQGASKSTTKEIDKIIKQIDKGEKLAPVPMAGDFRGFSDTWNNLVFGIEDGLKELRFSAKDTRKLIEAQLEELSVQFGDRIWFRPLKYAILDIADTFTKAWEGIQTEVKNNPELTAAIDKYKSEFQSLFGVVKKGFKSVSSVILGVLDGVSDGLIQSFTGDTFKELSSRIVNAFSPILKEIKDKIKDALTKGVGKDFYEPIRRSVSKFVQSSLGSVFGSLISAWDKVTDAIRKKPLLEAAIKGYKERLGLFLEGSLNVFKKISSASRGLFKGVLEGVKESLSGDIFKKLAGQISSFASPLIDSIKAKFGDGVSSGFKSIKTFFRGWGNVDLFEPMKKAAKDFISNLLNSVFSGISRVIDAIPAIRDAFKNVLAGLPALFDKFFVNFKRNLLGIGTFLVGAFVFKGIVSGLINIGKASFQTALQMEELLRTLSFSSSSSGVSTLEMLKQKADELSISFRESAQGYSQLAASTMGTRLEGATEDIFTGVATAVSARGLSNDQQSRAFMAISQIAAKGRVSMEELNQQLGEALPGALQTAARAMGMTTAELIKLVGTGGLMAEEFLPRFAEQLALEAGSSVAAAAGTATAQLTKFNNQLELLQAETGKPILGVLAAVLPTMNALLKLVADNMGLILPIVGTLAAALSFTLGKAILVVASELKLVNLFLSVFGIQLQGTMTAAGKAGVSIMGLGGAFKGLMASALPLIGIGLIFAGIVDAITPANEEMANAIKRMKELKRLEGAGAEKETATGDELLRITQEEIAARERNKFGAVELSKGALEGTIRAGQGGLTPKMLIPGYQQAQGFGTLLGLTIAQGTKDRIKLDKLTTKFGETSATAIKDIAESFKLPTDELRNEINQLDKEIRAKTFELNIAQAGGEDITELQAQLDELRDKRKVKIETEFPRYGELIGQISDVEKQINTITEKTQKGELSPEVFAQEYPKLVAQLEELQGYADEYADTTKVTKENIQEMAAALAQVQISMERATITAKQTTTEDLMALMDQRMAGTIDPVEFAQRQADITRKEVEAIAKATKQGRDDIQSQIDALNADTTNALNMAFKEIGFSDGLAQVLADGGSEAIEEAKRILASQGELDPAIEQALMKLERYAGLRDESIELEKQLAELELDRRQQEIDALQKIIDLENTRAQALINQSNLEAEIGLTAKQARGQLSDFQVQLLNFANQAKTAREEAKMLEASAKRNERAALEADLPEAREEFIRNATREALESQLKEQQAALADTQARVAMAMRPIELAQQLAQTRNEEQQLSDQIAVNIRTAARALTDFDKQYMGMIAQVNSLLTEVANLEDAAKAKREAAVTPGLAPDEQRRLEREARSDELMAAQKRSEIDLAKAEFNRASQMRDFELATRQATNANEELFLTRKLAIAQEQATATDAQSIAMANMVAQEKNLKAEQEYIQRKISLINRQIQEVQSLTMAGVIDMDSYNERIASLTAERLNLQNESVQRQIQLNQQEIDGFRFIGDQLVKLNEIRNQALEAQLKGYDRMTQAGNVYSDALGKEAELMQSQSDNAKKAADEMVQGLDKLQGTSGLMDNLRSTLGLDFLVTKKDKEAQAKLRKQVDDLLKQTKIQLGNANLDELQPIQLVELRQQLEQAKKLGIEGIDLGFEGFLKIQDEIARKNQQLADQKQQALDKEQASQRALLEIEAKRNRLAAQSAIREAEVAALRAKQSLIIAKNKEMSAVDPNEVMMAQLNVEMAEDELNFAMMGIDIAKQNAIFADELNQAKAQGLAIEQKIATQALEGIERTPFPEFKTSDFQGWKDAQEYRRARSAMRRATARGESFDWREEYSIPDYLKPQVSELDGSSVVDALMGISQTMESMVDLTKYDEMLSQLDKAAQPLEDQISIERQSLQATQGLTAGIDTLNQRIERLITTLGRPNISVGGDGSVAPAIEIMRASEQITRRI